MKRGQIKPRDIAVSFGAFLLVVGFTAWFASQIALNNPGAIDADQLKRFNNTFNSLEDYQDTADDLQSETQNVVGEQGLFGFLNSLINQAWNTLRTLFTSFGFITSAISAISNFFGIPAFITGIGTAVITLVFVFGVLAVIFNRDV